MKKFNLLKKIGKLFKITYFEMSTAFNCARNIMNGMNVV